MSVDEQVIEIQRGMAEFSKIWNERVQPSLVRDPRLPAQFIIDAANIVFDNVMSPVFDLQGDISSSSGVARVLAAVATIATGGAGGVLGGGLLDRNLKAVRDASSQAASTMEFIHSRIFTPLVNEAKKAKAAQGQKGLVPVAVTGADRFDQVILVAFQNGATTIVALEKIRQEARGNFLFRIGEFTVKATKAILAAVRALAAAIAAGARALYSLFKTLFLLAKVALVGGIGYVGYRMYQGVREGQHSLPAPQSNPRRRRARPRARGYLR